MDTPEDYQRLGINPSQIETWEDQRRNDNGPGRWEWWYFDAIMDDGTAVVIQFFTKGVNGLNKPGDVPAATLKITLPDGTEYVRDAHPGIDASRYGAGKCDVTVGPHSFIGDFADYDITVAPIDGIGAELHLHSLSKPFRPGTAYFGFGDHDEDYFTWLCAVPKGEVTGFITINGKPIQVRGAGYHDHQWGSNLYFRLFNHWTWARQRYDDYTVLVFDLITSEEYGYQRFPICFVQDTEGNLVFQSTHDVEYEVLGEYHNAEDDKDYPAKARWIFRNDGKEVEYTITNQKVLESNSMPKFMAKTIGSKLGPLGRPLASPIRFVTNKLAARQGMEEMSYARYVATGDLVLRSGDTEVTRSDDLIYEFMYPGATYKGRIEVANPVSGTQVTS